MTGLYALKPWYARRLRRVLDALVARRVRPTAVTWAGVGFGATAGVAIAAGRPGVTAGLVVAGLLAARLACANLDGSLARAPAEPVLAAHSPTSSAIAVRSVALAGCLAFAPPLLVAVAGLASVLPSWVSLAGVSAGAPRVQGGPVGKTERALLLVLVAFTGWVVPLLLAWIAGCSARPPCCACALPRGSSTLSAQPSAAVDERRGAGRGALRRRRAGSQRRGRGRLGPTRADCALVDLVPDRADRWWRPARGTDGAVTTLASVLGVVAAWEFARMTALRAPERVLLMGVVGTLPVLAALSPGRFDRSPAPAPDVVRAADDRAWRDLGCCGREHGPVRVGLARRAIRAGPAGRRPCLGAGAGRVDRRCRRLGGRASGARPVPVAAVPGQALERCARWWCGRARRRRAARIAHRRERRRGGRRGASR